MTADSSTSSIIASGEGGGGVISPSRRGGLPSPWAQVVRGGGEPETAPRSPSSSPSPVVAEQSPVSSDQLTVLESETAAAAESQPEGSDGSSSGNAGGGKKSAWNKPLANGVVEGTTTPVMGAASWPALSELTRPLTKSLSFSAESSSKPSSDGSATVSQAPVTPQSPQKPVKTNANSQSNPNHTHPVRQRTMKRGGPSGVPSTGFVRLPPPPPPPLPPFPLFDPTFGNLVPAPAPAVLDSPVREPPYKGNAFAPRPMGGVGSHSHQAPDQSSHRNPSRRNNFGTRPRGEGLYLNNGYGGRRDYADRDWHGPRNPVTRDVHMPPQMVPPPPPPPRGYIPPPLPGPAPFIAPQPLRPYGAPMGYEMAAPFLYVPTIPPEPFRGAPLLPPAAPPSMFVPVMDPPLHVLILNQIEYYFSDANLVKDNFLRSNMDEEGWVSITLIAGFPRVQSLTTDIQMILNSLRDSAVVEVQGDKLRRRDEWIKWVRPADRQAANSNSQPPPAAMEETSLQKLTLDDVTTNDKNILETKEDGAADVPSLVNWE